MRGPIKLMHDALDPLARRAVRNERAFVDEPQRARWLVLRDFALFVAVLVATFVDDSLTGWRDVAAMMFVAVYVGYGAFQTTRKMSAYRSGWLDGRRAIVSSLSEAQRRGLSADEWAALELARDFSVLGIDLRPPPPDGSHDDL